MIGLFRLGLSKQAFSFVNALFLSRAQRLLKAKSFRGTTISVFLILVGAAGITSQTSTSVNASEKRAVLGLWKTHKGDLIRFISCGRGLCGKVVKTRSKLKQDKNNPNPKLRKRNIKGLTIIRSSKKTGPKKWRGTVYNIEDGQTYKGSLKMTSERSALLTGCMASGFCKTVTWQKISKTRVTSLSEK